METKDRELFGPGQIPALRAAVSDLSWLLSRGYSETAALKLVGDRRGLDARQRRGVLGCACSDAAMRSRLSRRVDGLPGPGTRLLVDGLNCLITVQTALRGGLVLRGRDGAHRDLAGVHGAFRTGSTTFRAVRQVGDRIGAHPTSWYLDRPVSGSGELRSLLLRLAGEAGWPWEVELLPDPDRALASPGGAVVATSDSVVLDACGPWLDLAGIVIGGLPERWVVDLGDLPLQSDS